MSEKKVQLLFAALFKVGIVGENFVGRTWSFGESST